MRDAGARARPRPRVAGRLLPERAEEEEEEVDAERRALHGRPAERDRLRVQRLRQSRRRRDVSRAAEMEAVPTLLPGDLVPAEVLRGVARQEGQMPDRGRAKARRRQGEGEAEGQAQAAGGVGPGPDRAPAPVVVVVLVVVVVPGGGGGLKANVRFSVKKTYIYTYATLLMDKATFSIKMRALSLLLVMSCAIERVRSEVETVAIVTAFEEHNNVVASGMGTDVETVTADTTVETVEELDNVVALAPVTAPDVPPKIDTPDVIAPNVDCPDGEESYSTGGCRPKCGPNEVRICEYRSHDPTCDQEYGSCECDEGYARVGTSCEKPEPCGGCDASELLARHTALRAEAAGCPSDEPSSCGDCDAEQLAARYAELVVQKAEC